MTPLGESRTATRFAGQTSVTALNDLAQHAVAVFDAAAISVGSMVGFGLQKFIEQIAVGGMDFHAVKTGRFGPFRSAPIVLDNQGNFLGLQSSWNLMGFLTLAECGYTLR